jgi:hypothetical protein
MATLFHYAFVVISAWHAAAGSSSNLQQNDHSGFDDNAIHASQHVTSTCKDAPMRDSICNFAKSSPPSSTKATN